MAGHEQIERLPLRIFTLAFKIEAATLKRDQNLGYVEVGRQLDLLLKLIQRWDRQYQAEKLARST